MKRILIRLVTILLACLMLFSMVACSNANESKEDLTAKIDTSRFIMKNAVSDYKLLVPAGGDANIMLAASEFNTFFKESTGYALPIVKDSGLTFDKDSKYISLGQTSFAEQQSVSVTTEAAGANGYKLYSFGNSIFVVSPDSTGVLYGTYTLLNYLIDYEFLGHENFYVESNVSEVPFIEFNLIDKPSFDYRMPGEGIILNSMTSRNRFRYFQSRPSMPINGQLGHTSMYFLPTSKYFDENKPESYHPEWYMSGGDKVTQLCYTARGNQDDFNAMVEAAFLELKPSIIDNPKCNFVNFSLSDDSRWCKCSACAAHKEKYGAYSAAVIQFLNKLCDITYAWFETEEGAPHKREIYFNFYAYITLEDAPVTYDAKKDKFTIISEDVRCNKYVIPQLALTNANYTLPLSAEKNQTAYNNMRSWACVSEHIMSYMYVVSYRDFNVPYDVFSALPDWYQKYYENGCVYAYSLGAHTELAIPTGWSNLRIYLVSNLSWDCYADYKGLIDNFFDKAYGNAGDIMQQIFNEYRVLSEYNEKHVSGYVSSAINVSNVRFEKFWPKSLLIRWQGMIEDALEKVEEIKDVSPRVYESAKTYITSERVWINYLLYNLYEATFEQQDLYNLKTVLYNDITFFGLSKIAEGGSNAALLAKLLAK